MARLTNLGAGDLADRLTILALKLLHYGAAGTDTAHLRDERNTLLAQLRGRELAGAWFEHLLELGAVNAALWHATDALRSYSTRGPLGEAEAQSAAGLGLRILALNDRRAALVDQINQCTGEYRGAEKG